MLSMCFKEYSFCMTNFEFEGDDTEHFENNILDANESCDFDGREMQTFYCYNKGTCQLRLINYNDTHLIKEYYCICDSVI